MPAQQLDEYDYDLPADDDCWHLDPPRGVKITRKPEETGASRVEIGSYKRVGINARDAWECAKGDGVKVVIVENGIEVEHPSLSRTIDIVDARDFDHGFTPQGTPPPEGRIANRVNAHGTACAGLIGAEKRTDNRVIGIAPEARLVPVRISTNFEVKRLVDALKYASSVSGVSGLRGVILLPRFLPEAEELTREIRRIAQDVPVVCAAGNSGTASLVHPASLEETIAVGACNDRGYRSTYSQYGQNLDVVAPSNDLPVEDRELTRLDTDEVIVRIREELEREARLNNKPLPVMELPGLLLNAEPLAHIIQSPQNTAKLKTNLAARANEWNLHKMGVLSIATSDNSGDFGYNFEPAGDYCKATGDFGFGGTSAAAAQVAGVVALILSKNPKLTVDRIKSILRDSARVDCLMDESGNPPSKASKEFGYGLVDAAEAVQMA